MKKLFPVIFIIFCFSIAAIFLFRLSPRRNPLVSSPQSTSSSRDLSPVHSSPVSVPSLSLTFSPQTVSVGDIVHVNLQVSGNVPLDVASLTFKFPPGNLHVSDCTIGKGYEAIFSESACDYDNQKGIVRFAVESTTLGENVFGHLGTVNFKALSPGNSLIEVTNVDAVAVGGDNTPIQVPLDGGKKMSVLVKDSG